jgi:hypothetical protein
MPSSNVNNVWGQNTAAAVTHEATLPSGQIVEYRRLGVEALIEAGMLEQLDSLSALIETGPVADGKAKLQGHKKPKKAQAEADEKAAMRALVENPTLLPNMLTMVDKLLPRIVAVPEVRIHYVMVGDRQVMLSAEDREPGMIYADQIDFMDKMELFTLGVGDLGAVVNTFRGISATDVGTVANESGVPHEAQ